jgi:glycerophosphoryl diester phosphodiesterase
MHIRDNAFDYISDFKKAGLLVYSWTVDNPEKVNNLLNNGIDGITTNRASWMIEQLKIN